MPITRRLIVALLAIAPSVHAADPVKASTLKIDVVGQFIDLLNDLLKLIEGTTEFIKKQADQQQAREKGESLKSLQKSLETLSYEIQNSLYNGSNSALQSFRDSLERPGPHRLDGIAVWAKDLAAMTEDSIRSFSKLPKAFAVDKSYAKLLEAQNKRLALFRGLGELRGTASSKDVRRMRNAIAKWGEANKELESAIQHLNLYIRTFDVLATQK